MSWCFSFLYFSCSSLGSIGVYDSRYHCLSSLREIRLTFQAQEVQLGVLAGGTVELITDIYSTDMSTCCSNQKAVTWSHIQTASALPKHSSSSSQQTQKYNSNKFREALVANRNVLETVLTAHKIWIDRTKVELINYLLYHKLFLTVRLSDGWTEGPARVAICN